MAENDYANYEDEIEEEEVEEEEGAELADKLQHQIWADDVEKTSKVTNKYQLSFAVDTLLSNPMNKRFHEPFEGHSILDLFTTMTGNLGENSMVKFSNGTKTTELSVRDWKEYIQMNLSLFDCDDKSPDQNVWIRVRGKTVSKEDVEIATL